VLKTLGMAFALVVMVVFLFMGNLRAAVIPAVAAPVSLIGTFIFPLASGYFVNTVSLLAMALAIGIVVDDAIVVVENVERVIEQEPNLTPAEATKKAIAQITGPVIAINLALLSVFVPIAFVPGLSGLLFRQFAATICAAMLISAVSALTSSAAFGRVAWLDRALWVGHLWVGANHADELPPGGRSGCLRDFGATARRRVARAHIRDDAHSRTTATYDAANREGILDIGLFFA
jgi:multidrug efflux pump subunit AcrB